MTWTRRRFVVRAATTAGLLPLGAIGCTSEGTSSSEASEGSSSEGDAGSTSIGDDGTSESPSGSASTSADTTGSSAAAESSASGDASATSTGGPGSTGSESTGDQVCEATPEDIEGPFYRPGIPVGGDLDIHGDAGVSLRIEGRVLDGGCAPIEAAVVEVWHATHVAPGGEPGDENATYDSTAAYRYYGQVATDEQGRYAFSTLRPGWYLNGPQYRPAHVHVKVWVGDVERLTTQLYFEGDPFNDGDAWFNPVMALAPDERGVAEIDLVV